jgi:hypothetical protein
MLIYDPGSPQSTDGIHIFTLTPRISTDYLVRKANSMSDVNPEKYGFIPRKHNGKGSAALHALGHTSDSRFISASRLPEGADGFAGKKYYIDVDLLREHGIDIIENEQLKIEVKRLIEEGAIQPDRGNSWLANQTKELETLVDGRIPPGAIRTETDMKNLNRIKFVSRGMQVVSITISGVEFIVAAQKSYHHDSLAPIGGWAIRTGGGWAGAWVGMKTGATIGTTLFSWTGPGAAFMGAAGGIGGGLIGYFVGDKIANSFDHN